MPRIIFFITRSRSFRLSLGKVCLMIRTENMVLNKHRCRGRKRLTSTIFFIIHSTKKILIITLQKNNTAKNMSKYEIMNDGKIFCGNFEQVQIDKKEKCQILSTTNIYCVLRHTLTTDDALHLNLLFI